jgi:hypothetical protein
MNLDPRDESAVRKTVDELQAAHGEALQAVALIGDAGTGAYRPRRSPLMLAVVVAEITPTSLRRTRGYVRRWRRRRIGTPLMFDPLYLKTAGDVFPLELLDLADRHRIVHGQSDPFADPRIDALHLRLEVEEQMRGKLLHLWQAYLESGRSKRRLRRLLASTPPGFTIILRGMLRLRMAARPDDPQALLAAVEDAFSVDLPVLRRLEDTHHGRDRLRRAEVESTFEAYLAEVRRLVRLVDEL